MSRRSVEWLTVFVFALRVADTVTTASSISVHGYEYNPETAFIYAHLGVLLGSIVVTAAAAAALVFLTRLPRAIAVTSLVVFGLLEAVAVWNNVSIAMGHGGLWG